MCCTISSLVNQYKIKYTCDILTAMHWSWDAGTRRHKPFWNRETLLTPRQPFVSQQGDLTKELAIYISIDHCLNLLIHVRRAKRH